MKATVMRLYEGFGRAKAVLVLLVAALYMGLVAYGGGNALGAVYLLAVMVVYMLLPGRLLARLCKAEGLLPGFAAAPALLLGTGFFAALYCVALRLGAVWLLHVLPPLLAVCFVALWAEGGGARQMKSRSCITPDRWMLVLLVAALVLLYSFKGVIHNAHPLAVGDLVQNKDMLWNVGNANSFKLAFPPIDIRFTDVRLHYHYLTELVAGALSIVSGLPAYDIVAFYMQPIVLAVMVYCLYGFGKVVWKGEVFRSMLFTYSLFLFSCASLWKILPDGWSVFWNAHITHLITNINSVSTSVIFLCIYTALFVTAARKGWRCGIVHMLLIVAAFFLLIFSKGPLAGVVLVATALTLLLGLPLKQTGWRGLALGIVLAALFAVVYSTMFASGANDSMALSLSGTIEKGYFGNILEHVKRLGVGKWGYAVVCVAVWVVQSFLTLPAAFPLYLQGVGRDIRGFLKLAPERLLFNAVAVGGMLAFYLFDHPSLSQAYFFYGGQFFVTLLAVDGVYALRRTDAAGVKRLLHRVFVAGTALLAAVAFLTTCFLYANMLGSGARQLLRNLGVTEKYPYDTVVNADDEAAALWLGANSAPDAMFATNRIHSGLAREGISNLYSAFAGRQAFMEGFMYAKTNMGVSDEEINRRLAINTALFDPGTPPEEVVGLMRENGIQYLIFTLQAAPTQTELAEGQRRVEAEGQFDALELVFEAETVQIYMLPE